MKKIIFFLSLVIFSQAIYSQEIDNYLSPPFPTGLVSSRDGNFIAWVFNEQGSRNIYFATAPDFKAQKLSNYIGDDGLEITNLQFHPDGKNIYFIRGNASNNAGETANPAFLQQSTSRNLYRIDIESKETKLIIPTAYYKINNSGSHIMYLSGGQVHSLSLQDNDAKPEKLFHSRGGIQNLEWSPNDKYIGFVTNRSDHSYIGIYTYTDRFVKYIETTMDHDAHYTWSPDSKKIAYVRIPNKHELFLFIPQREHSPWSVRLYDLETDKNTELWKADKGRGSVLFEDIPTEENLIWWTSTDQIVFPYEKDGWQHLYSLDIKNKNISILTPGDGEIENVKLSKDKNYILYTCNISDIDRRHIWKYDFTTKSNIQLLKGNDVSWSPVEINNGIAYLHATATSPAWPAILQSNASHDIAKEMFPANFPQNLVQPQMVKIRATDGKTCYGDLFLPANHKPGDKHPALIFLHGGSRRQMLLGFNYSAYYSNAYALNQYFANQGYVVLALNFRSGIGYGFEFREALNYGADGASEYYDLLGAGLYLKNRADVNPSKIGLWGGSYGGYLTAHGLARASHVFACGVDIHGVHDWNTEMPTFVPFYEPSKYPAIAARARISSPLYYISGWKNPVLLIHGDDDRNVPIDQSIVLLEKLRKQNVDVESIILPDEVHGFLLHKNWLKTYKATIEYFGRKLK